MSTAVPDGAVAAHEPEPAVIENAPAAGSRFEGRRAGFVSRSVAFTIDFVIVLAGYPVMLWGVGLGRALIEFEAPHYPDIPAWADGVLSASWTILYFAVSWVVTGRTVGQALFGLRVVRRNQRRVGFPRAVLRSWVMLLTTFVIGPLWLLLSPSRLAIHDRLTRTQVIYERPPRRPLVRLGLGSKS